jgi:BR serine/threonine kinase
MLTVDVTARITIEQIKHHSAFRIALADPTYILPEPLPMPVVVQPIEMAAIPPPVFHVLEQVGFSSDDELRTELESPGPSMAKVFHHMLTVKETL